MTLPYEANSPDFWADVSCASRPDGRVDVTWTVVQNIRRNPMVWQTEANRAAGVVGYDSPYGASIPSPPQTKAIPAFSPTVEVIVFLRIFATVVGAADWPPGTTYEDMAIAPRTALPSGWHEVLYYGRWSWGDDFALPITTFSTRPATSGTVATYTSIDGGGA